LRHLINERLQIFNKNDRIQTFLQGLTPTESTDCSLWKATKKIKQVKEPSPPLRASQGTWARSNVEKAHAIAEHLANVFKPHPSEYKPEEEEALIQILETPKQPEPPINRPKIAEVQEVINSLRNHQVTTSSLVKFLKNCLLLD
jgi:hypothetical protein